MSSDDSKCECRCHKNGGVCEVDPCCVFACLKSEYFPAVGSPAYEALVRLHQNIAEIRAAPPIPEDQKLGVDWERAYGMSVEGRRGCWGQ